MLLLTTPELPEWLVVDELFSMIFYQKHIEISHKGLIRDLFEIRRNEYKEAFDAFSNLAPKEANAIIGIQVTTSGQDFSNGMFLYLSIVGTPIVYTLKCDQSAVQDDATSKAEHAFKEHEDELALNFINEMIKPDNRKNMSEKEYLQWSRARALVSHGRDAVVIDPQNPRIIFSYGNPPHDECAFTYRPTSIRRSDSFD